MSSLQRHKQLLLRSNLSFLPRSTVTSFTFHSDNTNKQSNNYSTRYLTPSSGRNAATTQYAARFSSTPHTAAPQIKISSNTTSTNKDASKNDLLSKELKAHSNINIGAKQWNKTPSLLKYQGMEKSVYNDFHPSSYSSTPSTSSSSPHEPDDSVSISSEGNTYQELTTTQTKIPVLDASPLFDPASYCRRSSLQAGGASINGTAAAKRLRQGRKMAIHLLQNDLCNRGPTSSMKYQHQYATAKTTELHHHSMPTNNPPQWDELGIDNKKGTSSDFYDTDGSRTTKAFSLEGHGVPQELLEDHIDFADSVLSMHGNALECSFSNFDGKLSVYWIRVRGQDGKNFTSPWPPRYNMLGRDEDADELDQRLQLYLTVMTRLSTKFGKVLDPNPDYTQQTLSQGQLTDDEEISQDDGGYTEVIRPHHWNVQFYLGNAYPSHMIPSPRNLNPIVELTQREGIVAPRNVRICLQGESPHPSRENSCPITMVFDACFSKTLLRR